MKRHGFILASGLVAVAAGPVHADRYFCIGVETSGNWNDAGNWRSASDCTGDTGIPTDADKVTIPSGKTCNVDLAAAEADRLVIESTATLNIQTSKTLTLDGDGDLGVSTIDGTIKLAGSSSELELVDHDQTLEGTGKIVGLDDAAKITMGFTVDLRSEITIEGIMHISGSVFVNAGTVLANRDGTLHVNPSIIDDTAGALWKVTAVFGSPGGGGAATLQYNQVLSNVVNILVGDFEVNGGGTLDIDDPPLDCTGKLTASNGGIVDCADGSATFDTP